MVPCATTKCCHAIIKSSDRRPTFSTLSTAWTRSDASQSHCLHFFFSRARRSSFRLSTFLHFVTPLLVRNKLLNLCRTHRTPDAGRMCLACLIKEQIPFFFFLCNLFATNYFKTEMDGGISGQLIFHFSQNSEWICGSSGFSIKENHSIFIYRGLKKRLSDSGK